MGKRIAETSIEAFSDIRPELPARHAKTFSSLQEYIETFNSEPTSGELTRWLTDSGRAFDVNTIRPDLTRLKDAGYVTVTGKRACSISGRRGFTWKPKYVGELHQ